MEEKFPHLIDRIQSTFIDQVFIIILMFVFSNVLYSIANPPDWVRMSLFAGIFFIYEPVTMSFGYTLGNYIKGIRVKRIGNTSKRINIFQSAIRYVFKILLGWLSFLTMNRKMKFRYWKNKKKNLFVC